MEIIKSLNKGFDKLQRIEDNLFEVTKVQLHPNIEGFNSPNGFGIYKTTGGDALGVVGKDFTPTQPKILFDAFKEAMLISDVDMNTLSSTTCKGDKKILFQAVIGKMSFINMMGKEDTSNVSLNLQTGFDGYTKTSMFLTTYRLICSNGMKAMKTEFSVSFKNTKGNIGKVSALSQDVAKAIDNMEDLNSMVLRLNNKQVDQRQVDEYLLKVLGYNQKDYNELNTNKQNILDKINGSIQLEFNRTGSSLWGLVNGITHYTNHVASENKNKVDYLLYDSGATMNNKAQKVAVSML